jgi:hypothetical protein
MNGPKRRFHFCCIHLESSRLFADTVVNGDWYGAIGCRCAMSRVQARPRSAIHFAHRIAARPRRGFRQPAGGRVRRNRIVYRSRHSAGGRASLVRAGTFNSGSGLLPERIAVMEWQYHAHQQALVR